LMTMALILDISQKEHLTVSLYAPASAVQSYETVTWDFALVRQAADRITDLMQRSAHAPVINALGELQENGQILFDYLIPSSIKPRLRQEKSTDLTFLIDESLVFIPWELLFDGQEFVCRRFNTGRRVKTSQSLKGKKVRPIHQPLLMHVIGDPQGNLDQARKEAVSIRDKISASKEIVVTTKTKNVYKHYLQKNFCAYDIWHYAGHADFDTDNPTNSGWLLRDGKLTGEDFATLGESGPAPSLIFMNACQSAFSTHAGEDVYPERGLFGLANTFLMTGGRFVIGTLIKVADDSALEMAVFFYQHLTAKENVGAALRRAREEFFARRGKDDLTWAAYILYGDPSGNVFYPSQFELVPASSQPPVGNSAAWFRLPFLVVFIVLLCVLLWIAGPRVLAWQQKNWGSRCFLAGNFEQASVHYQRALSYVSNDEQSVLGLYESYAKSGQYGQAIMVLKKLISLDGSKRIDRRAFVLNRALGHTYYALENYSAAYETFSRIADFGGQSMNERLVTYEFLANSASLALDFQQADEWYQKAIELSQELSVSAGRWRLMMACADNIRMANNDFKPDSTLMLSKAEEIYQKVLTETDLAYLKAQAYEKLGELLESNRDWQQASLFYQKALTEWEKVPEPELTMSQVIECSRVQLNLASLLIDPQLKFKEAFEHLSRFDYGTRQIRSALKNAPPADLSVHAYQESITILLRRFEILLTVLAQNGYQNSDLYKEAGRIYDRLMSQ
ncbi:MAG: CHAT domain-containing protein, partial [Candidatus Omnitrophica bacterium]|nr:CHAT domain-containing protein [Candidatus Omnitrophota bacterium]